MCRAGALYAACLNLSAGKDSASPNLFIIRNIPSPGQTDLLLRSWFAAHSSGLGVDFPPHKLIFSSLDDDYT
jgi:hypothetical protein